MHCNEIIADIQSGKVLPEYVYLTPDGEILSYFEICKWAFTSLSKDERPLYKLERRFGYRVLYSLDTDYFTPF